MSQTVSEFTQFTVTAGRSSLIMVPTYVNGRGPYNFILDTGAAHTLISPGLASSLGVQSESEEKAFGAGGAVQISLAAWTQSPLAQRDKRMLKSPLPTSLNKSVRRLGRRWTAISDSAS